MVGVKKYERRGFMRKIRKRNVDKSKKIERELKKKTKKSKILEKKKLKDLDSKIKKEELARERELKRRLKILKKEKLLQQKEIKKALKKKIKEAKILEKKKLSEHKKRTKGILRKYLKGEKCSSIGIEYGVSRYTVANSIRAVDRNLIGNRKIEARNKKIKEDFSNGITKKELSKKYQLKIRTIRNILKKLKSKSPDAVMDKQIVKDFLNGEKIGPLSKKYNISESSIRNILRNAGVFNSTRLPLAERNIRDKKIVEDYSRGGVTQKELSLKYGLNKDTIYCILDRWRNP